MRIPIFLLGLIAVAGAGTGRASAQNLVQNGNFAHSSYAYSSQFGIPYGGQGVTNWLGNGGYNDYFLNGTATTITAATTYNSGSTTSGTEKLWGTIAFSGSSPNGDNFVAMDGDTTVNSAGGGGVNQTINGLAPGAHYVVSFAWAGAQMQSRTGTTTDSLLVSLGSQSFSTPVVSNVSQGFTGWMTKTFTFTATATSELLSFLSVGTPTGAPPIALLTDVKLVPEPATMSVMGVGLMGLMAARRRRRVDRAVVDQITRKPLPLDLDRPAHRGDAGSGNAG